MSEFFKKLMNKPYIKPSIEQEFLREVRLRKEINSEHIWSHYYIPKAAKQIMQEKNGIITEDDNFKLTCLANALMFQDLADGVLTDLYKFKESEV